MLAAQGRWGDAAGAYEQVVARVPDALEPRVNLGVCRAAAGQLAEAADDFREVLKRDATRADAALRLADVLERLGEHAAAHAAAALAAKIRPDDPAALNLLASLSDRVGRADDAEGRLGHAIIGDVLGAGGGAARHGALLHGDLLAAGRAARPQRHDPRRGEGRVRGLAERGKRCAGGSGGEQVAAVDHQFPSGRRSLCKPLAGSMNCSGGSGCVGS